MPGPDEVRGGDASGTGASDRAIDHRAKDLGGKVPKLSPTRHSSTRVQGQERPSGPENNSKKTEELNVKEQSKQKRCLPFLRP